MFLSGDILEFGIHGCQKVVWNNGWKCELAAQSNLGTTKDGFWTLKNYSRTRGTWQGQEILQTTKTKWATQTKKIFVYKERWLEAQKKSGKLGRRSGLASQKDFRTKNHSVESQSSIARSGRFQIRRYGLKSNGSQTDSKRNLRLCDLGAKKRRRFAETRPVPEYRGAREMPQVTRWFLWKPY